VHDGHIALQALHHTDAILALRPAGRRQYEDGEKRRGEERETRDCLSFVHITHPLRAVLLGPPDAALDADRLLEKTFFSRQSKQRRRR
jgi:hypothetical protein